jgi:hypothetical protein
VLDAVQSQPWLHIHFGHIVTCGFGPRVLAVPVKGMKGLCS